MSWLFAEQNISNKMYCGLFTKSLECISGTQLTLNTFKHYHHSTSSHLALSIIFFYFDYCTDAPSLFLRLYIANCVFDPLNGLIPVQWGVHFLKYVAEVSKSWYWYSASKFADLFLMFAHKMLKQNSLSMQIFIFIKINQDLNQEMK